MKGPPASGEAVAKSVAAGSANTSPTNRSRNKKKAAAEMSESEGTEGGVENTGTVKPSRGKVGKGSSRGKGGARGKGVNVESSTGGKTKALTKKRKDKEPVTNTDSDQATAK